MKYFTVRSGFVHIRLLKVGTGNMAGVATAIGYNPLYEAQGKDPVFCESDIGLDNTDVWKEGL